MREPLRERCPLCPRADVLPIPEPMPRPTRFLFSAAFFGALTFERFMTLPYDPLLLNDFDQMGDLRDHAANRGVIGTLNHLIQPGEPQTFDYALLFDRSADGRTHPLEVNLPACRRCFFRCCHFRKSL